MIIVRDRAAISLLRSLLYLSLSTMMLSELNHFFYKFVFISKLIWSRPINELTVIDSMNLSQLLNSPF